MQIKSIELTQIRNISYMKCDLSPNLNVFIGLNGQGKTNLLEAMGFLSSLRSFRGAHEIDMIKHGESMGRITCTINEHGMDKRLAVLLNPQGKALRYQNQLIRKTSEFIGLLNTVVFSPLDMTFFDESPKMRRREFDLESGKISKLYLTQMLQFQKILKQRNSLLKEESIDLALLEVLTRQLVASQIPILNYRKKFVDFLNQRINPLFNEMSQQSLNLTIDYQQSLSVTEVNEQNLLQVYKQYQSRDIFLKATQKGIHRDDFVFKANEIEISKVCSQGQKRLVLLAFKLAIIEFIQVETQTIPVLLLDDVLSELDEHHQQNFLSLLPDNIQTIITTTHIQRFEDLKAKMKCFEIYDGVLAKEENSWMKIY